MNVTTSQTGNGLDDKRCEVKFGSVLVEANIEDMSVP
jgi:hypothetical protein